MHRVIEAINQSVDTKEHNLKDDTIKTTLDNMERRWILLRGPQEYVEKIFDQLLLNEQNPFLISLEKDEWAKIKGRGMKREFQNYFLLQVNNVIEGVKYIEDGGCELIQKYAPTGKNLKKTVKGLQWFLIQCLDVEEDNIIDMIKKHSNYPNNFGGDFIKLNSINETSQKKLEKPDLFNGYLLISLVDSAQSMEILKSVSVRVIKKYLQESYDIMQEKQDIQEFHWFLLRCRGGTEGKVIEYITKHPHYVDNFNDEFIQLVEYEKRNINKIKGINMFAGYFLVQMRNTHEARLILRGCRTSIIKEYSKENVRELISKILEEEKITNNKNFQVKEEVIVNTAIFNGEGVVISINEEKQTVMVQVFYFGAYNSISVPFTDLEKKRKS